MYLGTLFEAHWDLLSLWLKPRTSNASTPCFPAWLRPPLHVLRRLLKSFKNKEGQVPQLMQEPRGGGGGRFSKRAATLSEEVKSPVFVSGFNNKKDSSFSGFTRIKLQWRRERNILNQMWRTNWARDTDRRGERASFLRGATKITFLTLQTCCFAEQQVWVLNEGRIRGSGQGSRWDTGLTQQGRLRVLAGGEGRDEG